MNESIATQEEIELALSSWWNYLSDKIHANPSISTGTVPKLIRDDTGRTVKFSIFPRIAPELDGLGALVNASQPHVYVEGTKDPVTHVKFDEVYDHGRIVEQFSLPVLENDTPESLQERVLKKEHEEYPKILGKLIRGEYDNN